MTTQEWIEFIRLLRKLPDEKKMEIYYMIKGVAMVAKNDGMA